MFYLTLPSNSSLQYYPDNTLTHFTTQLGRSVDLTGLWEVGLAEIQYPHTWHNVNEKEGWICIDTKGRKTTVKLPAGQYDTPEQLIGGLNQMLDLRQTYSIRKRRIAVDLTDPTHVNLKKVHFSYYEIMQKATISVKQGSSVELSPILKRMLGMQMTTLAAGSHEGAHVVDVNQGFHSLYVYCNVVEPRPVGDSEVPLLRIVPIEGKSGQMMTKTYENIQYIPVSQKHFRTLDMDIKKDTGEPVPFECGKLVVTLHFRKRKPNLY